MLDDLKYIHQRDGQDALGIAEKQWQQLEHKFELPKIEGQFENIVYGGMGGSALAALISLSWPGYKVPFEIVKNYDIPAFISNKTLFIASSYSGNTEETISALAEAAKQGAKIAVITSGGKLAEVAKEKNYPLAVLPGGMQPRHAVLYNFKALICVLEQAGIVAVPEAEAELHKSANFLKGSLAAWRPDIATKDNPAKQLAIEIAGKSPVIYAGPKLWPAAYKWKISFNENAKNVAWCNQFSEFNHNEFLGWTSHPIEKPYAIIELQSNLEHERIQKRFGVTNQLLSGRWPHPHEITVQGSDLLEQLLWAIGFGDFVTIYLALLNGINPTPVDLIEKFKIELDR